MMLTRFLTAAVCFLAVVPVLATTAMEEPRPSDALPADPGLADYLTWSRDHHPALAAERHRADVLREEQSRAGALPGLRLAWGEMIVPVETRTGPQERVLSVSQSFPWFGTLGRREAAVAASADAADAGLQASRLSVERDVRAAWFRLGALDEEARRVTAAAELAVATEAYLRTSYETGDAGYRELLKAEMESGRLATLAADLRDRRHSLTASLNAAAGLPTPTPPPAAVLPSGEELSVRLPDAAVLRDLLYGANPELRQLNYRYESDRLGAEAVGKANNPSFTLGVDWIMTGEARMADVPDSGKDPVIARLAVQLPVWGGGGGAEDRAAAGRVRSSGAALSDRRLQLEAQLEQALYTWRDAGRRVALYDDNLLPRGRQAVAVVQAGYETGGGSFADLLDVRRDLLTLETEAVRRHLELALALNDLAHLVGVDLDDLAGARAPASPEESP